MGKAMREFGLECIRLRVAEIPETRYEIAEGWEAVTLSIRRRNTAIAIISRIAYHNRVHAVVIYDVRAVGNVTWLKLVQIFASNQPMHRGAQIREANGASPSNLALKSDVVLVDAGLAQTERHR